MSFTSQAVAEFVRNVSHPDTFTCRCQGSGWISSPLDSWEKCPHHFTGQRHPEDFDYDQEEPGLAAPLFEVTVTSPGDGAIRHTGCSEPYTRSGNLEWLTAFVASILKDDPSAKISINP